MIIRRTTRDDTAVLRRLAALDDAAALRGDALVAEVDGQIHAAVSLSDGRAIADPFRHTAALVDLLKLRAQQLTETGETPSHWVARLTLRKTARA